MPTHNLAEDAAVVRQFQQRGKRVLAMSNEGMFLYMRHGQNTWKFKTGSFLDPRGWRRVARPEGFPVETLQHYHDAVMSSSA